MPGLLHGAELPGGVALGRLHLDHVGAEVAELLGRPRAEHDRRAVHDPNAAERSAHAVGLTPGRRCWSCRARPPVWPSRRSTAPRIRASRCSTGITRSAKRRMLSSASSCGMPPKANSVDQVVQPGQPSQLGDLLDAVVGRADDLDLHVEVGGLLAEARRPSSWRRSWPSCRRTRSPSPWPDGRRRSGSGCRSSPTCGRDTAPRARAPPSRLSATETLVRMIGGRGVWPTLCAISR